ncbi:hypothetical protein NDU88_002051 [Pleurodeles waltl]|uniref:Uncharacterized protein n=1 Tax=Pleurodeles waltl TaxID=8319 RepID=A0AAV7VBS4_PLEWA|nr:hypothetical protein NDU88_002051 [Pleurodeles waltl]
MVGPRSHKKDALIRDLLMKMSGERTGQTDNYTQRGQSSVMSNPNDTEPVTQTFLESLFGALRADIAALKQDLTKDSKGHTKNMNELGDHVETLECTADAQVEELDAYLRQILELQDRNAELRYQVKDLENCSRRANIRT